MKTHLIITLALLIGAAACQEIDVPRWDVPENYFKVEQGTEVVFSREGELSLKSVSGAKVSLRMCLQAEEIGRSEGNLILTHAKMFFDLDDMSCRINKNKAHLYADNLPGSITCTEYYYHPNITVTKVASERLSGKYIFDVKLGRIMNQFGEESRLCEGDKLTGDWTIHFEADDGTRHLFKVSSVDIVGNLMPF